MGMIALTSANALSNICLIIKSTRGYSGTNYTSDFTGQRALMKQSTILQLFRNTNTTGERYIGNFYTRDRSTVNGRVLQYAPKFQVDLQGVRGPSSIIYLSDSVLEHFLHAK